MTSAPAWLNEKELQQFFLATREAGGEARAVGGCVRDFLMGIAGGDVDIASTLTPEQTSAIAVKNGWKAVPTGIAHGTVTLVLEKRILEVTTLRRDVETDGRHATVAYTDDWQEDAARRDFTMNALYMDAAGHIDDFFGGKGDLADKRVRFIGDATKRIEEDGLRILRFFRFLASHGVAPADAEALRACHAKREMIAGLSGERIQHEMKKLLRARAPLYALQQLQGIGASALVSGQEWHFPPLEKLLQLEAQHGVEAIPFLRLMAMLPPGKRPEAASWLHARWKLSRQCQHATQYFAATHAPLTTATIKEWLRHEQRPLVIARILLAVVDGTDASALGEYLALARDWPVPTFPVGAKDLIARGMKEGVELGNALRALEARWAESDYALTKEELLAAA